MPATQSAHRRQGECLAATLLVLTIALSACTPPTPTATPLPTNTPAPPTATPLPMAATVNGEGIPLAEWDAQVTEYIKSQTALGKTLSEEDAGKIVRDDLVAQVLLAQGARAAGFKLTPEDLVQRINNLASGLGGMDKLKAWETAHGYTEETFPGALERAAEAAHMRDQIINAVPRTAEQVHVQQILLYTEGDAISISNQLKGGADFNTMAAAVDPKTHGELSWFPRGYLLEPAIEEAAFNMQVGAVSEIIHTSVGYHIIKLLDRQEDRPLSPDAYLALQEQALRNWVAEQRAAAAVIFAP